MVSEQISQTNRKKALFRYARKCAMLQKRSRRDRWVSNPDL